jgi:ribonuclease D
VDKSATLTDWQRRPLTDAQVTYAAMDARSSFRSSIGCATRRRSGTRGVARARSPAEVVEEAERPDTAPWVGWGVVSALGEPERQVLDRLVRWRTVQASAKDKPLHYVLSDGVAVDLAAGARDARGPPRQPRIPQGSFHRHADEILFEIAEALRSPVPCPRSRRRAS